MVNNRWRHYIQGYNEEESSINSVLWSLPPEVPSVSLPNLPTRLQTRRRNSRIWQVCNKVNWFSINNDATGSLCLYKTSRKVMLNDTLAIIVYTMWLLLNTNLGLIPRKQANNNLSVLSYSLERKKIICLVNTQQHFQQGSLSLSNWELIQASITSCNCPVIDSL